MSHLCSRHHRWLLLALVALAFGLRVWQLGAQALRGDEAFDVMLVQGPMRDVLAELRATQPYPPLFHALLKGWIALAGSAEFALRFPALWCSVLMVPLAYTLAGLWFGEGTALWSAALLAVQPLSIWYAQDSRMYAALMLLSLASTWFAARLWAGRRQRWLWIGYVGTTYLALMTHYMAFVGLAAQQVCALIAVGPRPSTRFWRHWALGQGIIALLCLPWAMYAWPLLLSHTSTWAEPTALWAMAWRLLQSYTVGLTIDGRLAWAPVLAAGVSIAVVAVGLWSSPKRRELLLLATWIAVPCALVALGSLFRPMFSERYLVFLIAPTLILVGHGLFQLGRRRCLQVALAGLLVGGMAVSLYGYRYSPAYAKSRPWHELFDYLAQNVRAGDAVVYTFPDPAPEVYTGGRWPILILPVTSPPEWQQVSQRATQITADYDRIWLIPQWSSLWDESGMAEDVLDALSERAAEMRVGSWPLVLYHTPRLYRQEAQPVDLRLDNGIRLVGYALRDPAGRSVPRLDVKPGEPVRLTLYWQAETTVGRDYVVFCHVLDATGWVRGQQDNQPRQGTFPTRAWTVGEWVVDVYRFPVAVDSPPGEAAVEVGMYDPANNTRAQVSGRDADPEQRRFVLRGAVRIQ
jgi:4-amino-4-deoxy-L-arabinose transferase-like glycosyltransferase